jgi:hypothetical protein
MLDAYGPGYPQLARNLRLRDYKRLVTLRVLRSHPRLLGFRATNLRRSLQAVVDRLIYRWRIRRGTQPAVSDPVRRVLIAEEACLMAKRRYRFRPLDVRIHTFAASFYDAPFYVRSIDLGWEGQSTVGVRGFDAPSTHGKHIQPPAADGLARLILAQLEEDGPERTG